jgi:hypothetical protein
VARRVYRVVLWACCAYYYLDAPSGLVIVVGGGILTGSVGHIPIKFMLVVFVITIVTAWSILKSPSVRRKDEDPGVSLDLDREPALRTPFGRCCRTSERVPSTRCT